MKKATLGWDGHPTVLMDGGYVLPRKAEMILHEKYYPNNKIGEWPCDPKTGKKLSLKDKKL